MSFELFSRENNSLLHGKEKFLKFSTGNCDVNYLEHVEVTTTIEYSVRGDLELYLKSATGKINEILFLCINRHSLIYI